MAVVKLKSGKWQAVVSYRDSKGFPQKKKKSFTLKREAMNYETDFLRKLQINGDIKNESITYSDVVASYTEWNSLNANERTVKDNLFLISKFCEDIVNLNYTEIPKKLYSDIYRNICKQEWSISRKNRAIKQFKSVAKYASDHLDLVNRTTHLETLKASSDDVREIQVWTLNDLDTYINNESNYVIKSLIYFLYFTGLRIGEARALLKSDISNMKASITKSIRAVSNGFIPLKNSSSRRIVDLTEETIRMIKPLLLAEGDYLFGGLEPLSDKYVQRHFKDTTDRANVPKIKIHDLRHSHATLLINNGANIVAVSKRLGHSDVQTTLRTYTHLLTESNDQLMNLLNSIS